MLVTVWIGCCIGVLYFLKNDSIYTPAFNRSFFRVYQLNIQDNQLLLSDARHTTALYHKKGKQWVLPKAQQDKLLYINKDSSIAFAQDLDTTKHIAGFVNQGSYLTHGGKALIYGDISGVWEYHNEKFKPFYPDIIKKDTIYCIVQDEAHNFWLGCKDKIIKIDPQGKKEVLSEGLPDKNIYGIKLDPSGKIYFLTSFNDLNHRKLYCYDPATKKLTDLLKRYDLKTLPVDIEIDKERNVWFTTSGDGVYCITASPFSHFVETNGLSTQFVKHIAQDQQGNVYAGTINGLFVLKNNRFSKIKFFEQARNAEVMSLLPNKEGLLVNIIQYKPAREYAFQVNNSEVKPVQEVESRFAKYIDRKGDLWDFRDAQLNVYTPQRDGKLKIRYYKLPRNILIHQVFEYENKHWLATNKGLLSFREQQVNGKLDLQMLDAIKVKDGLPGDFVNVVAKGKDGVLWIGTKEGIGIWQNGKITTLTTEDGLISNNCTSILVDHQGHLWIGTSKGLSYFDGERFINFNHKTGLISPDISCLYLDDQKRLWIGTSRGISMLNIQQSPQLIQSPKLYLEQVLVNGVPQEDYTAGLNLKYGEGLKIDFRILTFIHPKGIRYQYRLNKGKWQESSLGVAQYNQFSSGDYTFEVRAKKFNSLWSAVQKITFEVSPPLWRTWWAFVGYIIGLALLVFLIVKWRSDQLKKEKLHLERVVAERTHQLEQQKEEITLQAEKLKEVDELKSRFFSNISHELKTPLAMILGPAENLQASAPNEKSKAYTQYILANTQRLMKLINQLMDFSKLEVGKMKLKLAPGNLKVFLDQVLHSFEPLAQQKQIDIVLKNLPEPAFYEFDQDKIEKVLFNLLSNAFKFTPNQGKITLQCVEVFGGVQITVTDNGLGIPSKQLPYIFERFYQVDSSQTREFEGTGIGLSLVKELVELHHGTIKVESRVNEGTTFVVDLPLLKKKGAQNKIDEQKADPKEISPKEIDPKEIEQNKAQVSASTASIGQATIDKALSAKPSSDDEKSIVLVVEDNLDLRNFICQELSQDYEVIEAKDGKEGIEQSRQHMPDLIISDVMMPKVDGFELLKQVKTHHLTSHIPVIMLTAKASFEDKISGLEMGSDEYLTKPFSPRELQLRVRNLLARRDLLREYYSKKIGTPDDVLDPPPNSLLPEDEALLKRASEIVEQNINNTEFDVTYFRKEIGMSQAHLFRKLKALTNMSTTQFIRAIKLKKAASLIREKAGKMEDIAFQSGFNDISYFNRCFKKQFNMTPTQYEKMN